MISYFFNIVVLAVFCLSVHSPSMAVHKDTLAEDVVKHFDVIVIGSGSGTKLVRPVADLGFKVAVIEQDKLGGTCLNRGCIPSKMLIHVADLVMQIKKAPHFHLSVDNLHIDFPKLMHEVASVTDAESDKIEPIYAAHKNITLYRCTATFLADHTLQVGDTIISAPRIFIATGVDAYIPPIAGLESVPYMTYREALRQNTLPKKLLVIGGGYIAAELGYFYGAMGSETHFFVRRHMLSREDTQVRKEFEQAFSKMFDVHHHTEVKQVEYHEGIFTLIYENDQGMLGSIEGDALLVATGMRPLTETLGLEHTHIQVDKQGFIVVDDYLHTTAPGVFAFGDCIGRYGFRHSANYEGEYLFKTLFGSAESVPIIYNPMPHAIFTHPQLASVGKTEEVLVQEGRAYMKGICRYEHSAMGMALKAKVGSVKLLFDTSSHELIGAHIVGEEASDMIHVLIAFMNKKATLEDLTEMIYIHPALPELIRNAARQAK